MKENGIYLARWGQGISSVNLTGWSELWSKTLIGQPGFTGVEICVGSLKIK